MNFIFIFRVSFFKFIGSHQLLHCQVHIVNFARQDLKVPEQKISHRFYDGDLFFWYKLSFLCLQLVVRVKAYNFRPA